MRLPLLGRRLGLLRGNERVLRPFNRTGVLPVKTTLLWLLALLALSCARDHTRGPESSIADAAIDVVKESSGPVQLDRCELMNLEECCEERFTDDPCAWMTPQQRCISAEIHCPQGYPCPEGRFCNSVLAPIADECAGATGDRIIEWAVCLPLDE